MASADVETLYKEIYSETVPKMWTVGTSLANVLMKAEKIQGNTRAFVLNQYMAPGGDFKGMTFDGDSYAKGNNIVSKSPSLSTIGISLAFNGTTLMKWCSNKPKIAVQDFMDDMMAGAVDVMKNWVECLLNAQDNDGVMAILSGVQNTTEYIMNSADDPFGGYLLIEGGRYDIIASAAFPATTRVGSPYRILPDGGLDKRLDPAIVSFSIDGGTTASAITGFVAEDRVVARGLADASINPLAYHINGAASGTWQNRSRTLAANRSSRIDGSSGPLTSPLVDALLSDILKYKGQASATSGLQAYAPLEQITNWKTSAQAVANIYVSGDGPSVGDMYDRYAGKAGTTTINNGKPIVSNRANPTEFRLIRVDDFLWPYTGPKEIEFEKNEAGGIMHRNYDGDGNMESSHSFYLQAKLNLGAKAVDGMGVIDTLSVP